MTKKFKIIVRAAVVIVALAVATSAVAQSVVAIPFIGQGYNSSITTQIPQDISGSLQIANGGTYSYGGTNTWVNRALLIGNGYFYTNTANSMMTNYYTDPIWGTTYTNGQIAPLYITNTLAIADIDLWCNRDGTPLVGSLCADIVGLNASFTNIVTFNFALIYGVGTNTATSSMGSALAFSLTGNGTTHVNVASNLLASATLQGARKIRLVSVVSTNAGTNGQANVWLCGSRYPNQ